MLSKYQFYRLLKYFFFWVFFFLLAKLFFLISTFSQSSNLSWKEFAGIFWYGSRMDISTACYLLSIPCLLLVFRNFISAKFINRFVRIYTLIVLALSSLLMAFDLGLYPHWGIRISVNIFNYIDEPAAVAASVSLFDLGKALLLVGGLVVLFRFLYSKLFLQGIVVRGKFSWPYFLLEVFVNASLIIPIRGWVDTSPLNLSSVAYTYSCLGKLIDGPRKSLYWGNALLEVTVDYGKFASWSNRYNRCRFVPHSAGMVGWGVRFCQTD